MKKILIALTTCCMLMFCVISVSANETRSVIDYNTTTTKQNFTGSLGYANFTSIMRYNNNTGESALTSHYSTGYPKSGYNYSTNNSGAGAVTYKGGNIYVTWNWTLRDTRGNTVDSGKEVHMH